MSSPDDDPEGAPTWGLAWELRVAAETGQWELVTPDVCLVDIFSYLTAVELCRARCACVRWAAVGGEERLWRALARRAVRTFHPDPRLAPRTGADGREPLAFLVAIGAMSASEAEHARAEEAAEAAAAAASAGGEDEALSLSAERQMAQERSAAARAEVAARKAMACAARTELLRTLQRSVSALGGWARGGYRLIPQVRTRGGVYALRHSYIRKPHIDLWHAPEGILECVYHRTFFFRPDGTLLYAMLPGGVEQALQEFRRALGVNEGAGAGAGAGAVGAPPLATPLRLRSCKSPHVGAGFWYFAGDSLHIEAATGPERAIATRWRLSVAPPPLGDAQLVVQAMQCFDRRGDAEGVNMASFAGLEFFFHPVRGWGEDASGVGGGRDK